MNFLNFPQIYKILNLTPFKISLCALINHFLKDTSLQSDKDNFLFLFDIIKNLIKESKCEISKKIFVSKIEETILILCKLKGFEDDASKFSDFFKDILEMSYNKLSSLNELYIFFNLEIRELKTKNDMNYSLLDNGGIIDQFIKKCLFAFYKFSFEEICNLYLNLSKYIQGEELNNTLTNKESEILFEKQLEELSLISTKENYEIEKKLLENYNYKQEYYFNLSITDSNEQLERIHRFFDHNMKYFYNDNSQYETKIHYSLLNLVEYYFNKNYYTQAIHGKNNK